MFLCVTAAMYHDTASDGSGKSGCGQQAWPSMVGASTMHVVAYSMLQGSSPKQLGVGWIVLVPAATAGPWGQGQCLKWHKEFPVWSWCNGGSSGGCEVGLICWSACQHQIACPGP